MLNWQLFAFLRAEHCHGLLDFVECLLFILFFQRWVGPDPIDGRLHNIISKFANQNVIDKYWLIILDIFVEVCLIVEISP